MNFYKSKQIYINIQQIKSLALYLVFLNAMVLGIEFLQTKNALSFQTDITGKLSRKISSDRPADQLAGNKQNEEQPQSFDEIVQETQKAEGLFTIYQDKEARKVYLEIKPEQLNKNFLFSTTIESGIGERDIYSADTLDTFIFYFRRVNNKLHFVLRNVNFRADAGDPQRRSVNRSFSDSVLASIPIESIHPERKTILINLDNLFLTKDLPDLSSRLKRSLGVNYVLEAEKSYFGAAKVFPLNLEIDTNYGFSLSENEDVDSSEAENLPDRRFLSIRVHYSLSELPQNNGYRPRLADERVGYYTANYRDFSQEENNSPIVRYINRWHLEKQDPNAPLSPPKKPIVFWIENTVPIEYREAIKEGILMWNIAFEKIGFKDALEVRQMSDNANWNPADIRYNTIRWVASTDSDFVAIGPVRVNPLTGEILDADIVVDANYLRGEIQAYRTFVQKAVTSNPKTSDVNLKKYLHQSLSHTIAHEIGHTLGLRHNFRASTLLKPEELNNIEITRTKGISSSVMDYLLANIAPSGTEQGDYYPTRIGSYDLWAIEYGYKPSMGSNPQSEKQFLQQIAEKQADNQELSYATDEDTEDLDPTVNTWDLSSDPLRYSESRLDNARSIWESLNKRYVGSGDNLGELKEIFNRVYSHYDLNLSFIVKYIGGQTFYRDRAANFQGKLPFEVVPLEKQREALAAIQKYVFAEDAFNFSPELLNRLATSRWMEQASERLDYPIHSQILLLQNSVLKNLLSKKRLMRLRDIELKVPPGQALTMPELFNTLQAGIWTEVLQPDKKQVKISSVRRALQAEYLNILVGMVLRTKKVPEDARSVAWQKLRQLRESMNSTLRKQGKNMDDYTKAHLEETRDRITKVLDAPLTSKQNK